MKRNARLYLPWTVVAAFGRYRGGQGTAET